MLLLAGCWKSSTPQETLTSARAALQKGELDDAIQKAGQIPASAVEWNGARLVMGEAATKQLRFQQAADYYRSVTQDGSETASLARLSLAEVLRELGRLSESIGFYQQALSAEPDHLAIRERLAFLMSATGRTWEAAPHFRALIESGTAGPDELVLFADAERPVEQYEYLEECHRKAPNDPAVRLGLAAAAFQQGRASAVEQLQTIVRDSPGTLAAQAMLGELLVDQPIEVLQSWHAALPESADAHPGIWYVRGAICRRQNDLPRAAFCLRRCLAQMPSHRRATYQLGQVLTALKHPLASRVVEVGERQSQLSQALDDVLRTQGHSEPQVHRVTELLQDCGRVREACAWALWADAEFPGLEWPRQIFITYQDVLTDQTPQIVLTHDPVVWLKNESFPQFAGLLEQMPGRDFVHRTIRPEPKPSSIAFDDVRILPDFTYFNGDDPSTQGVRLFEQTGGGVAVIDFDQDHRPDLYLPQGLAWPSGSDLPDTSDPRSDVLIRNRPDGTLADAFEVAGLCDSGFGQGCAAGDFDGDGFTDLYIANIGRNVLLLNQGDGTFRDVSAAAGLLASEWTTSVLMTDLNADGHPDLYDVGYLSGPDVFQRICQGRACSPSGFAGCRDRLLIGDGRGGIAEVPETTPETDSKGLGIVTVFTDNLRRPNLFVANDQVANHFLTNEAGGPDNIRLSERGMVSGLAVNDDGLSMACMGIAADDVNSDGRTDLFVTNFRDEANTLYLQVGSGFFTDATRLSGLAAPGMPFVGWGTQFLDADLDGESDLVVTNGHVDDYRDEGGMYHMRPQLYRGQGNSRFVEVQAESESSFFAVPLLGRGLARVDWNGDGRPDFVVSCLMDHARIVLNTTLPTGRFLNVRLHAATTARDAIGARVTVSANGRSWTRLLLAGDGYMASNERLVSFGLGAVDLVDTVRVEWPSGAESMLHDVAPDCEIELVEGKVLGTRWLREQPESLAVEAGAAR